MNTVVLVLAGIAGATATFWVAGQPKYGPVRASALLSLLVGVLFYLFPHLLNPYLTQHLPPVFCGATFIGMASAKAVPHRSTLVLAGGLFTFIYLNASTFFKGYGGALGTSASIALMAALGVGAFLTRHRVGKRMVLFGRKFLGKW